MGSRQIPYVANRRPNAVPDLPIGAHPAQRDSTNASTAATTSGLKASTSRTQTERVHRGGR
jgi:hypothetical protein